MKMKRIVSSETSELKDQTPGDYPKDTIRQVSYYQAAVLSEAIVLSNM